MNMKSLTPVTLRIVLSLCLIVLIVIGVGLFMVGYGKIKAFAVSTQETADKAQASQSSVQDLVTTKKFLEDNSDAVNRASQLVAESKSYSYQDQIINDINTYARQAGISITNISFTSPTTAAVGATSAAGTPAGVKSMVASVTLKNPTNYNNMLNFIHYIEQSLFRMQVSQIGLSSAGGEGSTDEVSSDILSIEVYVR